MTGSDEMADTVATPPVPPDAARAAAAASPGGVGEAGRRWRVEALSAVVAFAALLSVRWGSIQSWGVLNADESQAVANAARIVRHGYSWNALDGTTVGPLNSIVLLWPKLLGLDVTHATARLTAAALLAALSVTVLDGAWTLAGRRTGLQIGGGFLAMELAVRGRDLVHYNTELLPLTLATLGFAVLVRMLRAADHPSATRALAAGLLVASVPFAKLQLVPVAVWTGVVVALLLARRLVTVGSSPGSRLRRRDGARIWEAAAFAAGAGSPILVFVVPLLLTGSLPQLKVGYLEFASAYVGRITTPRTVWEMAMSDRAFGGYLLLVLCLITALATASAASLAAWRRGSHPPEGDREKKHLVEGHRVDRTAATLVAVTAVAALVAYYCVVRPGKPLVHYATILAPFLALLLAASISIAPPRPRRWGLATHAAGIACLVVFALLRAVTHPIPGSDQRIPGPALARSGDLMRWVAPLGGSLLVWGWMPQWYAAAGMAPATRETQNYAQITATRLRPWFRDRFREDLARSQAEVVVDAVTGRSFWFNDPHWDAITTVPGIAADLDARYTRLTGGYANPGCPTTWARKDVAAALAERTVAFRQVTADRALDWEGPVFEARNLDDFSVFEDTCRDYWLLPDATPGTVTIEFTNPADVSEILLLNTRNDGASDRSTRRVRVVVLRDADVVLEREVDMRAYPEWTVIDLPVPTTATGIQVDVLSWYGFGGGLNEVKVWR